MTTPTVYRPRNPPEEDNPPGWASDDSTELRNFTPDPNPLAGQHTERFVIKVPDRLGATQTLYFWAPATRGQDVKEWIYQETGLPTSLFHLVFADNGSKLKNTDIIDDLPYVKTWQTIVVVLEEN